MKVFPTKFGMTLTRYDEMLTFKCDRCDELKSSKLRAKTATGEVCNGCYGKLVFDAQNGNHPF